MATSQAGGPPSAPAETHQVRSPGQAGLTLVELVIAVPLAAGIALMAFFAVRSVMQSARIIQRATEDNAALRAGWLLAMNEADCWSSHANPDYPYLRGHNAVEVRDYSGNLANAANKRLFRPIPVTSAIYTGHDLLPHDERSWYVGPAMSQVHLHTLTWVSGTGYSKIDNSLQPATPIRYHPDPMTTPDQRPAGRDGFIPAPPIPCLPAGWEGWHLHGDFAAVDNLNKPLAPPPVPPSPLGNETGQQALVRIYGKLGHLGTAAYMSPGTVPFPLTEPVNRPEYVPGLSPSTEDYFGVYPPVQSQKDKMTSQRWSWGEIPWALCPNLAALNNHTGVPSASPAPPAVLPLGLDPSLTNFINGMPSGQKTYPVEVVTTTNVTTYIENMRPQFTNQQTKGMYLFPVDYQTALNRDRGLTIIAGIYPARGFYSRTGVLRWHPVTGKLMDDDNNPCEQSLKPPGYAPDWDHQTSLDSLTLQPFRLMNYGILEKSQGLNSRTTYDRLAYSDLSRMEDQHTVTTSFAPAIPGDSRELPVDRAPVSLRLSVLRTNLLGYDRVTTRIKVSRAETGKGYELELSPLGSSFRGARWYWGLRAPGVMGDYK